MSVSDVRLVVRVRAICVLALAAVIVPAAPAIAASSQPNGGSGLSAAAPKKSKKKTSQAKPKAATISADPTKVIAPADPSVAQDGGTQHLGERSLKQGMKGHDVRVLQGYLTLAGLQTGVDGDFGAGTKSNVIKFEAAHGLLPANGIFTYADSLVLRKAVAGALAGGAVGKATINSDGTASAPSGAPQVVQKAIAAANRIIHKPYIYAGGHGRWNDSGYDCSGSVSYALHGANLLSSPEDSGELESYGSPGPGRWMTIYANSGHTWIVIAGRAFDTAHYGATTPGGSGPRWLSNPTGNLQDGTGGYVVRHPSGL